MKTDEEKIEDHAVFRCTKCGQIYWEKVTQCDCMPDVQEYEVGYVTFTGEYEKS